MSPKLCEMSRCSGCGACRNVCRQDAISFEFDEEGFLSPRINADLCVDCKRCEKVCPVLNPPRFKRFDKPIVYACWSADAEVRALSSSGGMFTVYAKKILEQKGFAFGVAFNENNRAVFMKAESVDELAKMRSSKYVQADVGTIYRDVRAELDANRLVLFSGTPCQVAALRACLGKEYPNLFALDLICHGAPSPTLFKKWFETLDQRYDGRLEAIDFRAKERGWTELSAAFRLKGDKERTLVSWDDEYADYVGQYFIANVSLRASCGRCPFATIPRQGDVTLGDFWAIGLEIPFEKPEEIPRGVSLNLVNSKQGARLVDLCKDDAVWFERSPQEAKSGNPSLIRPSKPHRLRKQFVRDSVNLSYLELRRKYFDKLGPTFLQRVGERIARRFRKIVGKKIRRKLAKLFGNADE